MSKTWKKLFSSSLQDSLLEDEEDRYAKEGIRYTNKICLLISIAEQNRLQDLKQFMKQNPSFLTVPLKDGLNCLHICSQLGFSECVEFLLQRDVNANAPEPPNHLTALHFACLHGHTKCIKVLLAFNAKLTNQTLHEKKTPLHYAAQCGLLEPLKVLLSAASSSSEDHSSILTPSEKERRLDSLKSLTMVDIDGHTPLHLAVIEGNAQCVRFLVDVSV
jgi:ankyrin repeat protein